eukprot:166854_1
MDISTKLPLIIILNLFIPTICATLNRKDGNALLSLNSSTSTNNGTLLHFMTTKQRRDLLNAEWGIWQTTNATLPQYIDQMVCGHYNGSIFFIGACGLLWEYSVIEDKITDHGAVISTCAGSRGQYYVQVSHMIYMIGYPYNIYRNTLATFNLETKIYTNNWGNVTLEPTPYGGCIASWNDYLFVIGGVSNPTINSTQILNTSSLQWLDNTPRLNVGREGLACIVNPSNKKLFAMGGLGDGIYLNSIEVLLIDISNIETSTWQLNGDNLLHAMHGTRCVLFGDNIYVIGGSEGQNNVAEVSVIDTTTGQVTSGGYLSSGPAALVSAILVNGVIYVFPGHQNGLTGEYINLVSNTPSESPTNAPSAPTITPTRYPTASDAYSQIIAVSYQYHELEKTNIDDFINLIDNIIVILEDSYVELSKLYADNDDEVLYYKQFQITMTERDIEQNYDNNSVIITSSINYEEAFVGNTIIFISKKSFI